MAEAEAGALVRQHLYGVPHIKRSCGPQSRSLCAELQTSATGIEDWPFRHKTLKKPTIEDFLFSPEL